MVIRISKKKKKSWGELTRKWREAGSGGVAVFWINLSVLKQKLLLDNCEITRLTRRLEDFLLFLP